MKSVGAHRYMLSCSAAYGGADMESAPTGIENVRAAQWQCVPGRGSCASPTSCAGFCMCWCIPPRSSAVTPVRHSSRMLIVLEHGFKKASILSGLARQLKDHAVGRQVDDLCLVDAGDLPQLGAVAGCRASTLSSSSSRSQARCSGFSTKTCRVTSRRSVWRMSWFSSFSVPRSVTVMRLTEGSFVADTVRLSMLKPRRQNRLEMRARTPLLVVNQQADDPPGVVVLFHACHLIP